MNIGMDGLSVNQVFQCQLKLSFENKVHKFVSISWCLLHIGNIEFKVLVKIKSVIDLKEKATDLQFFFKCSAAGQEESKLVEEITAIIAHFIKKPLLNQDGYIFNDH